MDLAAAGSWASIVGLPVALLSLAISVYVALTLRRLRRRLVFLARADEIIERIDAEAYSVRGSMANFADKRYIVETRMAVCLAHIHRIRRDVSAAAVETEKSLRRRKRRYDPVRNKDKGRQRDSELAQMMWDMIIDVEVFLAQAREAVADWRLGGLEYDER